MVPYRGQLISGQAKTLDPLLNLCIIADDLTGALDTAAKFQIAGMETKVLTHSVAPKNCPDLIVFDCETRVSERKEAYNRTVALANRIKQFNLNLIYVKVDSTLRGNVGAVLDALIDTLKFHSIILSPSFPAQGRTVSNGNLRVRDRPLADTDFFADVHSPVVTSHVPTLLESVSTHQVEHVGLGILAHGGLKEVLEKSAGRIVVVDAVTDDDLKQIAQDYLRLKIRGHRIVAAGSAELGGQLAPLLTKRKYPVLILGGSISRNSREQIKVLTQKEEIMEFVVDLNTDIAATATQVNSFLNQENDVLLRTSHRKTGAADDPRIRRKYAKTIARIVTRVDCLKKMIIMGGETAYSVMEALGLHEFEILEEVLPGVPLCTASGLLFISKAGGFGDSRTLVKLYHYLKDR